MAVMDSQKGGEGRGHSAVSMCNGQYSVWWKVWIGTKAVVLCWPLDWWTVWEWGAVILSVSLVSVKDGTRVRDGLSEWGVGDCKWGPIRAVCRGGRRHLAWGPSCCTFWKTGLKKVDKTCAHVACWFAAWRNKQLDHWLFIIIVETKHFVLINKSFSVWKFTTWLTDCYSV